MRKKGFSLFGIVVLGAAIFTQAVYAQEAPDSLFDGSAASHKVHRFGASLGLGGLTYEASGADVNDDLFTFELGGSYAYMWKSNMGLVAQLRPFFAGSHEGDIKQDAGGFQVMAGIRYIFPAIYQDSRFDIAPYAAGKIGFGYVNFKASYGEEMDMGGATAAIDYDAELDGGGFCLELELGLEMNTGLYIAFVYNFQGGSLKGEVDVSATITGAVSESWKENISSTFEGNFVGLRVGYQF